MGFSTPPSKRRNEVFGDIPEAEDEDVDRETVEKPGFVEDGEDGNGSQVNQDPPPLEDSAVPTPAEETQEVQDLVGVAKEAKKIPGLTIQVRPLSNVVEGLKEDKSDEDWKCLDWQRLTVLGRQTIQTQLGGQFPLKIQDTEGVNLWSITYMGWRILWLLTCVILSIPGVRSWSIAYQGWIRDP